MINGAAGRERGFLKSHSYRNGRGPGVVIATHASIADWTTRAADPTHLVANFLA
jgi:hypothetical protein